jgi:hypothetical protein
MKWKSYGVAVVAVGLAGCGVGRIVTAPVRIFYEPGPGSTPSNSSNSDVTTPGRPVAATPSPTVSRRTATRTTGDSSAQPSPSVAGRKSSKSSASSQKSAPVQFPVAKPVPGKPGLVFNPFNSNGAYIDVSGYAPGSKVKDPDSQKIFVVP